ncbi:MAG: phosphotransferase, partial [Oscillospiraceae bacterium]|nr:phosphotransferase [Oscillospiraceae bacterium]
DIDNTEPSTFGEGGFKDPADLLTWLEKNKPSFEPALSHGDLCLPNILIDGGKIGYIDIGDAGIGDKWRDLVLLSRSLRHNTDGTYGKVYPGYYDDMLFDELGIAPDREKLRYYTLLDELF